MFEGIKHTAADGAQVVDGAVRGKYVFDNTAGAYRFEWSEPCELLIAPPGKRMLPTQGERGTQYAVKYRCCLTPDYFAEWSQVRPQTISSLILRPVQHDSRDWTENCGRRPFDPLAAGIMGYADFAKGKRVAEIYDVLREKTVESFRAENGVITMELRDEGVHDTLVVDKDRLVPLEMTSRSRSGESWVYTSQASWTSVEGVVVPTSITQRLVVPDVAEELCRYTLAWKRINEDFGPEEFEYTAFSEIPPGIVEVFDTRSEEVKHLGLWVGDGKVERHDVPSRFEQKPLAARGDKGSILLMIGLNILVVVLLYAAYFSSQRRRSKKLE